ncbi:hypothetical protein SDRG_08427 [Saprolegnia diclina VS20]|uniref:Uncharacterized protein n=1 Tax=Saprolegnia diclina (strain VS20) TaxID=1156394 RepID=T0QKC2_SAPDV|nr:hypothetical protein SDRG_08427 [Saprolegnia diclina VS20]EQC34225.1 hypothetical protein SDRG_08427 [Saprolegnia diclina VS20]|eukprot:XP_008612537.1 hypothetical protein SDRG_08427 [Saprolegnia diclina VS20]
METSWVDANGLALLSDVGRSMNLTGHAYTMLLDAAQAKLLDYRDKDPLVYSVSLLVAGLMAIVVGYMALRFRRAVLACVAYIIVLGVLCFITGSDPFAPLAVLAAVSLVAVLARSENHLTHVLLLPSAAVFRAFSTYCLDGLHTSATTLLDVVADATSLDMRILLIAFALGSAGIYCYNGRFAERIKSAFVFVSLAAVLSAWLSVVYALGLACLLTWLQRFDWALLAMILCAEFAFVAMPTTPVVLVLRDIGGIYVLAVPGRRLMVKLLTMGLDGVAMFAGATPCCVFLANHIVPAFAFCTTGMMASWLVDANGLAFVSHTERSMNRTFTAYDTWLNDTRTAVLDPTEKPLLSYLATLALAATAAVLLGRYAYRYKRTFVFCAMYIVILGALPVCLPGLVQDDAPFAAMAVGLALAGAVAFTTSMRLSLMALYAPVMYMFFRSLIGKYIGWLQASSTTMLAMSPVDLDVCVPLGAFALLSAGIYSYDGRYSLELERTFLFGCLVASATAAPLTGSFSLWAIALACVVAVVGTYLRQIGWAVLWSLQLYQLLDIAIPSVPVLLICRDVACFGLIVPVLRLVITTNDAIHGLLSYVITCLVTPACACFVIDALVALTGWKALEALKLWVALGAYYYVIMQPDFAAPKNPERREDDSDAIDAPTSDSIV